jgi:hypothetical protein
LQERNPELKYCILEERHEIGGTWSLFQYPGELELAENPFEEPSLILDPRHPVRFGSVHLRVRMEALDQDAFDRARLVNCRICPELCSRRRHQQEDQVSPPSKSNVLVYRVQDLESGRDRG